MFAMRKLPMFPAIAVTVLLIAGQILTAGHVVAQEQRSPWSYTIDGGGAHQADADFKDAEGGFEVDRWFVSGGIDYSWNRRNSVGLKIGGGLSNYNFDSESTFGGGDPWGKAKDFRVSLNARFKIGEKSTAFIVPTIRYNGESGADSGDSQTFGLFAAIAWRINEELTIGPGVGVFSRLEDSTRFFPVLAIDWNINERWNLGTGAGLAASQGPGLTLSYKLNPSWTLGLSGRYEDVEFRLDDEGAAPGGIGRDQSFPLVVSGILKPNQKSSLSLFAGLELGGKLKLQDSEGETLEKSSYDPAFIVGATFAVRF
jgi:hypothetical protein